MPSLHGRHHRRHIHGNSVAVRVGPANRRRPPVCRILWSLEVLGVTLQLVLCCCVFLYTYVRDFNTLPSDGIQVQIFINQIDLFRHFSTITLYFR